MSDTVLVTGAAGTTSRELVRLLADSADSADPGDIDVRAGVHTPSKADVDAS